MLDNWYRCLPQKNNHVFLHNEWKRNIKAAEEKLVALRAKGKLLSSELEELKRQRRILEEKKRRRAAASRPVASPRGENTSEGVGDRR